MVVLKGECASDQRTGNRAWILTLERAALSTPYMRTSWTACRLKDSSTFVYGARRTCVQATSRKAASSTVLIAADSGRRNALAEPNAGVECGSRKERGKLSLREYPCATASLSLLLWILFSTSPLCTISCCNSFSLSQNIKAK